MSRKILNFFGLSDKDVGFGMFLYDEMFL